MWRYNNEKEALWRKLIKGKYGSTTYLNWATWIRRQVGDGASTLTQLGGNLKDDEAMEWAELTFILAWIALTQRADSWIWIPKLNGSFSTKIFLSGMVDPTCLLEPSLARAIWEDKYPKKIKFFLWELSHRAMNTKDPLQRRRPIWSSYRLVFCVKVLMKHKAIFSVNACLLDFPGAEC